jgi:plasmid maintenance system antidote protein VapI
MVKKDEKEARAILAERLAADQRNISWLARLLDVTPSTAARWISGATRPTKEVAGTLQNPPGCLGPDLIFPCHLGAGKIIGE